MICCKSIRIQGGIKQKPIEHLSEHPWRPFHHPSKIHRAAIGNATSICRTSTESPSNATRGYIGNGLKPNRKCAESAQNSVDNSSKITRKSIEHPLKIIDNPWIVQRICIESLLQSRSSSFENPSNTIEGASKIHRTSMQHPQSIQRNPQDIHARPPRHPLEIYSISTNKWQLIRLIPSMHQTSTQTPQNLLSKYTEYPQNTQWQDTIYTCQT